MKLNQTQAVEVIQDAIINKTVHQDYAHCVEYAAKMKRWVTGVGIEEDLRRYNPREGEDAFRQRCNLTKSITPALIASAMNPFKKVVKSDRVVKQIKSTKENSDLESNKAIVAIQDKMDRFFGSDDYDSGLDYWLKTRFFELTESDPNAFIVIEVETDEQTRGTKPYPFEVNSEMAINFDIENNNIDWLLCQQHITFLNQPDDKKGVDGIRLTWYGDKLSIVYHQTSANAPAQDLNKPNNESILIVVEDRIYFWVNVYTNFFQDVPSFRIGYMRDLSTDGRTYVVPYHNAECWIDKSITTVSQFDITNATQVFPKTFQYVTPCTGEPISDSFKDSEGNVIGGRGGFGVNEGSYCNGGRTRQGGTCRACNGSGVKVHKSGQDIVTLPLPAIADKDEMYDLSKMMATFSPPIDLLKFQDDLINAFETKVHRAIFNSAVMIEKSIVKTATEATDDVDNVYDALSDFASKCKSVWLTIGKFIAKVERAEDLVLLVYKNPNDWKLKTATVLYNERKLINDSGAPSFVKTANDDDLANRIYADDTDGLIEYKVKKQHIPFLGKTDAQIEYCLIENFTPLSQKVLFTNFDDIFFQAKNENVNFILKPYKARKDILDKIVQSMIEQLQPAAPVTLPKLKQPPVTQQI